MALIDRFKGGKRNSVLPDEMDEYYSYSTNGKEKRGLAVLLGLATLVGTLLLALLIFFGGRAVYQGLNNDNDKKETAQTNQNGQSNQSGLTAQPGNSIYDQANQTAPNLQGGTNTSSPPRIVPNNSNKTPSSTPPLGDEPAPEALPRTGDEGM